MRPVWFFSAAHVLCHCLQPFKFQLLFIIFLWSSHVRFRFQPVLFRNYVFTYLKMDHGPPIFPFRNSSGSDFGSLAALRSGCRIRSNIDRYAGGFRLRHLEANGASVPIPDRSAGTSPYVFSSHTRVFLRMFGDRAVYPSHRSFLLGKSD